MISPRQRFKRTVERRTNKSLKALRLLSRCFERPWYQWTPEEAETVLTALREEIRRIERSQAGKMPVAFSLTDQGEGHPPIRTDTPPATCHARPASEMTE